jgi:peptide/nickel transport system substrate-binding protein
MSTFTFIRKALAIGLVFIFIFSPLSVGSGATLPTATTRHGGWLDEIDVSVVAPENSVTQLSADTIDLYAGPLNSNEKPSIDAADLKSAGYGGLFYSMLFNPAEFSDGRLNPFHDHMIRQAINWLVDRNYINTTIYSGAALPKWFPITTQGPEYSELGVTARALEEYYSYNFAKAQQVIQQEMTSLGATLESGKWMYDSSPVTLIFLIRTDSDGTRRQLGDYVADQLEAAGFTVDRQYGRGTELSPIWVGSNPVDGLWSSYTAGWTYGSWARDEKTNFQEMYLPTSIQGSPAFLHNDPDPAFQLMGDNLANGSFTTLPQRHQMMADALGMALQDSLQVWLIDGLFYAPYQSDVEVAGDLAGGIEGSQIWPLTLRFTGTEGGTLRWADSDLFTEPWNPVAGSNSGWDQSVMQATRSSGLVTNPYNGLPMPWRIASAEVTAQTGLAIGKTYDWLTLSFANQIDVPADAWVDWNAATQTFIPASTKYPAGTTAKIRSVVQYPADLFSTVTWQDGSLLSVADFLMPMIMLFDQAKSASAIYDPSAVPAFDAFMSSFKGFRILATSPLTIEYYTDNYYKDAELNVYPLWPNYGFGEAPWHVIAAANSLEADGFLAYSADKAVSPVAQTDFVNGISLLLLSGKLADSAFRTAIPYAPTLGTYITSGNADTRYTNLQNWNTARGHYWVGTGPYYLHSLDYGGKTLVLRNNTNYPDLADRWSSYASPRLPQLDLTGPAQVDGSGTATYDAYVTSSGDPYPAAEVLRVDYALLDSLGMTKSEGMAAFVEAGHYRVALTNTQVGLLGIGPGKIILSVTVKPVCIPAMDEMSIPIIFPEKIFLPLIIR